MFVFLSFLLDLNILGWFQVAPCWNWITLTIWTDFLQGIYLLVSGFFRLPHDLPKVIWRYPMMYIGFHMYALQVSLSLKHLIVISVMLNCDRQSWLSLYSLIWDFFLSQINIWTTTTWSDVWVILPKASWYEFLIGSWYEHPLQSICILQHSSISVWLYPCSYICNCLKMSKKSQTNEYSDWC